MPYSPYIYRYSASETAPLRKIERLYLTSYYVFLINFRHNMLRPPPPPPPYNEVVFICGHLGRLFWWTYAKSKSTKVSENADLIKVETYVQQGKIIDNQVFIGCHNVKKVFTFFPCSPGPGSSSNGHNKPILLPRYHLTHINVPVK